MDGCSSIFRWQGEIHLEREVPVLIKSRADRLTSLQQEILTCNPFELPGIMAVPVEAGFQPYLDWLSAEVDAAAQTRTGGGPK
jgi:periplasmic divalent cation tolerance protein